MNEDPVLTQAIRKAAAQQAMQQKAADTDKFIVSKIGLEHGKMLPCPICGKSKWKTVLSGLVFRCRTCGYEREAEQAD